MALFDLGPGREQLLTPGPVPSDSKVSAMEGTGESTCPGSCSQGSYRGMECGAMKRCQCLLQMATLSVCGGGWLSVSPRQLLQHECPKCPELPPFSLFGDLEHHMRKQHELFCCKLCLKYLKVHPHPHSTHLGLSGIQGEPQAEIDGGQVLQRSDVVGLSQTALRGWLLPQTLDRPDP